MDAREGSDDGGASRSAVSRQVVEALERLVFGAVGITAAALERAAPDVDLTLSQWRVLVIVGRTAEGIRVGEIAAWIGAAAPSASRLVRRLERRGLVVTARDSEDRRVIRVRLTERGRRVRQELVQVRRALLRELLASHARPIPPDLVGGLGEVAEALGRYA